MSSRLPAPEQRAHDPALLLAAAVAEDRLHLDARGHVHHRARLGHDALAGIELDLDELQVLAVDLGVDLVGAPAGHGRRRGRARAPRRRARNSGTSRSGVQLAMPSVKRRVLASIVPFARFWRISSSLTGPTWWPPTAMYHCFAIVYASWPAASSMPRGRLRFEPRRRRGVEAERVRELGQEDALRARDALVRAHDREGQDVELLPRFGSLTPATISASGRGLWISCSTSASAPDGARLLEDRGALLVGEAAVGAGGGDGRAGRGAARPAGSPGGAAAAPGSGGGGPPPAGARAPGPAPPPSFFCVSPPRTRPRPGRPRSAACPR